MDNTITKPSSRPRGRFFLTKADAARLAVSVTGFFVGRMILFGYVSPAAIGFLASFAGTGAGFYLTAVFIMLGIATKVQGVYLIRYLICVCLLCAANILAEYFLPRGKNMRLTVFAQGMAAAVCLLIGGLGAAFLSGAAERAGLAVVTALESALAFFSAIVLSKAAGVLTAPKRKSILNNEELISLAALSGCIIAGAMDIYVGPVSLRYLLSFYLILMTAYQGDGASAAAAGTLTGLLLFLAGAAHWDASMAVVLSLAGLAGGLMKNWGKPYAAAAFVLAGGAALYMLNRDLLNLEAAYSASFAVLLFLITPWRFNFHITAHLNPPIDSPKEYVSRIREMAAGRIGAYSEVFARLGHKFGEMAASQVRLDNRDAVNIIDNISAEACASCPKRQSCWEDGFYDTYQYVFGLLGQCEKTGKAQTAGAPGEFLSQCVDPGHFISIVNSAYDLYKSNMAWKNSVAAGREMISQQLSGISEAMRDLAGEIDGALRIKDDLEEKTARALIKGNLAMERVTVLEDKDGRYEVNIRHPFFSDNKPWERAVAQTLGSVLKRRMQADEGETERIYNARFIEERAFGVTCGAAGASKGRKGESGDSYSFVDLPSGHTLLVVSDGMGSGKRARDESSGTVDLLENFLESGFEKRLAVKIINSVLTAGNKDESFATLDICTVNLYTAEAEFVKLGAAPTYIIHDGKVSAINSSSLPIGMLKYVDMEVSRKKLAHGDVIVMITDGVADAPDKEDKDGWVAAALGECEYVNPQDIADYILFEAQRLSGGPVNDDMTVLAARVWEK